MKQITQTSIFAVLLLSITMGFTSCNENDPEPTSATTGETNAISTLSEAEKSSLLFVREEEKLARDVYAALYAKWGLNVFSNITQSEQKHLDAMLQLINKYNLTDPVGSNEPGKFNNQELQKLYDDLVAQGSTSQADALKVGATIEDLDLFDLKNDLAEIDNADIILVYNNLLKGSRNHLRAFYSSLLNTGVTYVPQYITQQEFDSIVNSAMETGR